MNDEAQDKAIETLMHQNDFTGDLSPLTKTIFKMSLEVLFEKGKVEGVKELGEAIK